MLVPSTTDGTADEHDAAIVRVALGRLRLLSCAASDRP